MLVCLVAALMFAGCGNPRLSGVVEYDPLCFLERTTAGRAWNEIGTINDAYIPGDLDEIEIRVMQEGGAALLSLSQVGSGRLLLHDVESIRVSVGLLRELEEVEVQFGDLSVPIDTKFKTGATWKNIVHDVKKDVFEVSLRPRRPVHVGPGDKVHILRTYVAKLSGGADSGSLTADAFTAVVDPEGYLTVPLLAKIGFSDTAVVGEVNPDLNGTKYGIPALRRVGSQIETAYSRIRVWAPGWRGADRPSLPEIGECLGVGVGVPPNSECPVDADSSVPPLPADFSERCRRFGIEPQHRVCPRVASSVHYQLAPAAAVWTLVDAGGQRMTVAYRHGDTVAAGAREQYRRLRGTELIHGGLRHRDAFLTVIPGPHANNRAPFYLFASTARSSDALILPGDTVVISKTVPLAAEASPFEGAR